MRRLHLVSGILILTGFYVWPASPAGAQEGQTALDGGSLSTPPPRFAVGESLVPAAFGIRNDVDGNSWSIEADGNIGRIGSTMVNSGLMLMINEEKFTGTQPAMSPDGRKFVIHGMPLPSQPGLRVQRRIILMERTGGLCYAELFYNGSTDAIDLSVGLATNFSGNYKTFLTDRGRSEPVVPSHSESAIIVVPGTSESPKAFLFTFANANSPVKPSISAQNRYGLTYRYQLSLEAGESKILVHHVAQVRIPQSFDRRSLLNLSLPFRLDGMVPSLPEDWKGLIANLAPMPEESPESALRHGGLQSLGFSRGARDLLALGGGTQLPGDVVETSMEVSSVHGNFEIELGRVAAIIGEKGTSKSESRIFLSDGQILTATIKPPGLTFAQTGGETIRIESGRFDRLVMSESGSAGDWKTDSIALIETIGGDRIKVRDSGDFSLGFSTLWGDLKIEADNLLWVKPAGAGIPGYRAELRDGTRCYGFIAGEEILLTSTDYGEVRLPSSGIKYIFTNPVLTKASGTGQEAGQKATVRILSGDQEIIGSLEGKPFPVMTGGGVVRTAPSEIRRAARIDPATFSRGALPGEAPLFEIERWDGGVIKGGLILETIAVRSDGIIWQIPVRDVEKVEIDSPLVPADVAGRIAGLVQQLGDTDWAAREAATRALGAFGYLARSVLQRELASGPDPEVERRIKRILEDLK